MPINKILENELIKTIQENGQSKEFAKLCIEFLTLEHDNPDKLNTKNEIYNKLEKIFEETNHED